MGLFEIDDEYDSAVHVSPSLADNILNERYVNTKTIFKVNIMFEQDTIMIAYIDLDYFKRIGLEPFSSISIDFNDEESISYRFLKDITVSPQKSFNSYMKKIGYISD